MREEFEKLPEIAEILKNHEYLFNFKLNQYLCEDLQYEDYLNGAWYTYQEQQKKIDKAIEYLDSIEGLVWYEQIKDILK